ncbi:MAG: PaaI family thioesterase [Actinomycetota bacterium]
MDEAQMEADLRDRIARSAFHSWMGMELVGATRGRVEVALEVTHHHLNLQGSLHGGVMATLADTATGLAVRTMLPVGRRHVTIQLDVHYLAPGRLGQIIAVATTVRVGSQVAYAEADIRDGNDRLLARATATVAVMTDRG